MCVRACATNEERGRRKGRVSGRNFEKEPRKGGSSLARARVFPFLLLSPLSFFHPSIRARGERVPGGGGGRARAIGNTGGRGSSLGDRIGSDTRDPATAHPTTIPQPLLRFIRCSPSPLDWPPVAFLPAVFGHVTQRRACCHDRAVSPSPPRHRFASLPSTNFQHSLARRLASPRLSPTRSIQRLARSSVLPPRVSNFPFPRSTRRRFSLSS